MRLIQFIFFSNYFLGILAVMLSVEASAQLSIPLNSPAYYILIVTGIIVYYTTAYRVPPTARTSRNPRTEWYRNHYSFVRISQWVCTGAAVVAGVWFLIQGWHQFHLISLTEWALIASVPLAALSYYGILPLINLRQMGWLKPFVIGFVWAGAVTLFPAIAAKLERGPIPMDQELLAWFFLKNWMFCTVNAIMFDMKDYADDANRQLKTFVVRVGLRQTIFYILIPLLTVGLCSLLIFAWHRHLGTARILMNLIPFLALLAVAYSLHHRKNILYYLVVIDGLLLVKACCGIIGVYLGN